MKRTARVLALAAALAGAFLAGRLSIPPPELEIRRGRPPWVEVWYHGRLASEWQPRHGIVWYVLSGLLASEGDVPAPLPGEPGGPKIGDPEPHAGPTLPDPRV